MLRKSKIFFIFFAFALVACTEEKVTLNKEEHLFVKDESDNPIQEFRFSTDLSDDIAAYKTVVNIVRETGLAQNFVILPGDVEKVKAYIEDNERILEYNPNFIENIQQDISHIVDNILYKDSKVLITGIPTKEMINNKDYYYNSMIAIDQNGKILGKYDKKRLVPFGEYNPFKAFFSFFNVIATDKEFSKGRQSNQFFTFK